MYCTALLTVCTVQAVPDVEDSAADGIFRD